jgi:hypothetical protein
MGSPKTRTITISKSKAKVGGSSKKGRQHAAHTRKYMRQKDRTAINKNKAWKRHLKKHPNDVVAAVNIKRLMGAF